MHPKISCRHIWKIYGPDGARYLSHIREGRDLQGLGPHHPAVRDVSFDVMEGELFVIMGLSGSGKSTLARCLNGLTPQTHGRIAIDGEDLLAMDEAALIEVRRRKVAMVFQNFSLFPHRTVLENVVFGLAIRGEGRPGILERGREILRIVGLDQWENFYPGELSGGMQQRVGLARALAPDPEILVMDEPFSALDPLIRRQMHEEFIRIMDQVGKTIIFITHDLNEAVKLGSRIAIMKEGEIIQLGTAEEIACAPANDYVAAFVKDINRQDLMSVRTIMTPVQENADRAPSPEIAADSTVSDLIPLAAGHSAPVAVVDEKGQRIGEVSRSVLLKAMSRPRDDRGSEGPANGQAVPARTAPAATPAARLVRELRWAAALGAVLLLAWLSRGLGGETDLSLPLGPLIDAVVNWMVIHFAPGFDLIKIFTAVFLNTFEAFLLWLPWWAVTALTFIIALRWAGAKVAGAAAAGMVLLFLLGLWDLSMATLALTGTAVVISNVVGIPLGILAARSDRIESGLKPLMDLMQTMPAFVYLIPALMFFGIGRVPGVMACIVYGMPPAVRLTSLGIRQVPPDLVEAARSFGATRGQLLFKVQLPLALPSIMAGVNQTIMLSLGMVVLTAMIAAGGLGKEVLLSLGQIEIGRGFVAGLSIVILAIILDRVTQAIAKKL